MKKFGLFVCIAFAILSLALSTSCKSEQTPSNTMPPLKGGQEAKMIELTIDDFSAQNHITREVTLIRPGSMIVSLGANPTTGFSWSEAENNKPSVVSEQSHTFVPPQTQAEVVGAPGKDVWVFDSQQAGKATITMSYSRPWEGGEKDQWTLTLNVSVE
jgi:predicted secreted protein